MLFDPRLPSAGILMSQNSIRSPLPWEMRHAGALGDLWQITYYSSYVCGEPPVEKAATAEIIRCLFNATCVRKTIKWILCRFADSAEELFRLLRRFADSGDFTIFAVSS